MIIDGFLFPVGQNKPVLIPVHIRIRPAEVALVKSDL
jgi:hypothetical protein